MMDFVILKVNGHDLASSTHEEAVEAFRTAKEPIIVEVLRRVATHNNNMKSKTPPPPSPTMVTVATQTEEYTDELLLPISPTSLYYDTIHSPFGNLVQPSTRRGIAFAGNDEFGLTDIEMANDIDYSDGFFEERNNFEMDYEEVTLCRTTSEEKVGLTLCYGSADDDVTDIFISEVEPYSVAARTGRIREGDQILQINGVDVHCREQAIRLFAGNHSDISLLLAHPQIIPMDDGFMDEATAMEELHFDILEQKHAKAKAMLAQVNDEEGGTTDTATTENSSHKHEKDSGVGKTDDSTRNDESSEQELLENDCVSPSSDTKFSCSRLSNGDLRLSNDSFGSSETPDRPTTTSDISAKQCEKFHRVLETRCRTDARQIRCGVDVLPPGEKRLQPHSLQWELAALNHEVEKIQLECQEIVKAQQVREYMAGGETQGDSQGEALRAEPSFRSARMVPRMGTRLDYIRQVHSLQEQPGGGRCKLSAPLSQTEPSGGCMLGVRDEKDTSTSAYNTGESCRSTPLTLELHDTTDSARGSHRSMLSLPNQAQSTSDPETVHREHCRAGLMKAGSINSVSRQSQTAQDTNDDDSLQELYAQYADVMYTNKANLQHTIMVQQKLFEQQLAQRATAAPSVSNNSGLPDVCSSIPATPTSPDRSVEPGSPPGMSADSLNVKMKWVVKRRGDGSRYITRRPVRNELLKARARKVAEERCGMTTDDDAVSELKVGRYWNKDERRRHLEKVREHKHRKEQMLRQKMETLKESEEMKKEPNIVQLSHRKMMRHKAKRTLDNFVTMQEMLAHGNRDVEGKTYNPLLSVTTV